MASERYMVLLRELANGPCGWQYISDMAEAGTLKAETKNGKWGRGSLKTYISRLVQRGLIKRRSYFLHPRKGGRFTLYAIGERGGKELIQSGEQVEDIRRTLPEPEEVLYTWRITALVRVLKREGQRNKYDVRVKDKEVLEMEKHCSLLTGIPDLLVTLLVNNAEGLFAHELAVVDLERDESIGEVLRRLNSLKMRGEGRRERVGVRTLVAYRTPKRYADLLEALQNAEITGKLKGIGDLRNRLLLATWDDLFASGLSGGKITNASGRIRRFQEGKWQ